MNDLWGDAMMAAFQDMMKRVAVFLPKLLALFSFILLGIILAWVLKLALQRLLQAVRVDVLSERWGVQATLAKSGFKQPLSQIVGRLAFWMVFVLFVFMGVDALDLPATAALMGHLLGFFPSLVTASLLLLVGVLLGNFLGEATLIAMVNAQIHEARLIANCVRWGVFLFTISMVLTQLGIAKEVVVSAFSIILGGVVLALSIAIGLGGRNIARDALERRWRKAKDKEERDEMAHL
ncbi:MAG: hypothetical protein OEV99_05165 [Nitrospira sp.]|nr:hypothetical protein [Nitrospira sp.]MDH4369216.1 hypothetical protein [Nitrospira sp.]MDH5346355.1 hypothetical protein [Nitrospira sp.]MDH5496666.1 hypothetical protein [Nitrospira sp.]MDH5724829.1 hypothetical protein [Nitrospira sp.]